jgi:protein-disulfide isomerase
MKIKRNISTSIHLTTLVITTLVFIIGIFIGLQIASQTTSQIQQQISQMEENNYNLQILTLVNSSAYSQAALCNTLEGEVNAFQQQTVQTGLNLQFLEGKYGSSDPSVVSLKKQYSTLEARDFLLLQRINGQCGNPYYLVLYFYSNANCPSCQQQGNEITSLRQEHKNVMVYSFDLDLEGQNPEIELLASLYNVTSTPTIIIPGQKLVGLQSAQQLDAYYQG